MHVILTIGLSEIPILIAAYRLCRICRESGSPLPSFSALCLSDTTDEAERVRHRLVIALRSSALLSQDEPLRWTAFVVSHSKPDGIRQTVTNLIKLQRRDCLFHLHYTGGSRAISVHAMEALVAFQYPDGERCRFESSYIPSGENALITDFARVEMFPADERSSWALSVSDLSELNGFTTDFVSTLDGRRLSAKEPSPSVLNAGCRLMTALLAPSARQQYSRWLQGTWESCWRIDRGTGAKPWNRWPQAPPPETWPETPIRWLNITSDESWPEITENLKLCFGGDQVWGFTGPDRVIHVRQLSPDLLSALHRFLHHECLELLAYRALKSVLLGMGYGSWAVNQSVHVARAPRGGRSNRDFEVDVLAVLGYQLLAISCSLSMDQATLKRKAFEILHRAKQVGGVGAHSVLLCVLDEPRARDLLKDVQEDTSRQERTLDIWGIEAVKNLERKLSVHLRDALLLKPPMSPA